MIEPTDREFAHELRTLKQRLSAMAERASEQIELAMEALTNRDDDLANQVIANDEAIDNDESDIDRLAMEILMTKQPVASDLRFVTMALKFVTDVERIGDMAVNIAKRVCDLAGAGEVFVSGAVPPLVTGAGFEFDDRGEYELKGVPGSWRLFAVRG